MAGRRGGRLRDLLGNGGLTRPRQFRLPARWALRRDLGKAADNGGALRGGLDDPAGALSATRLGNGSTRAARPRRGPQHRGRRDRLPGGHRPGAHRGLRERRGPRAQCRRVRGRRHRRGRAMRDRGHRHRPGGPTRGPQQADAGCAERERPGPAHHPGRHGRRGGGGGARGWPGDPDGQAAGVRAWPVSRHLDRRQP